MNPIRQVFRKELREMARDKRVVYSALVGPVFLVLLFLFLFGFLKDTLEKREAQTLHVVRQDPMPAFLEKLKKDKKFRIETVATRHAGEVLVKSGSAKALLLFSKDFDRRIREGKKAPLELVFDPEQPRSAMAASDVSKFVAGLNTEKVKGLLASKGISADLIEPIDVQEKPLKREKESFGGFLVGILPYLVVIWAFYGGFSVASDFVAGEKERSTLETLLITPVSRMGIALGKFWALTLLCFSSSASSLVAVVVAGKLNLPMIRGLFPQGAHLDVGTALALLAVILPLCAMFAGLLLALSAKARNTRECQGYFTLLSFVVIMPAVFSQFIGFTDFAKAAWVSWVPVLNSASVLRSAMLGNLELAPFATTLLVNVLLAAASLVLVVRMFHKEEVLWRI